MTRSIPLPQSSPSSEGDQDDPPPSLFKGLCSKGLFLFLRLTLEAGWTLAIPGQLQSDWEGVILTIARTFVAAFQQWAQQKRLLD